MSYPVPVTGLVFVILTLHLFGHGRFSITLVSFGTKFFFCFFFMGKALSGELSCTWIDFVNLSNEAYQSINVT